MLHLQTAHIIARPLSSVQIRRGVIMSASSQASGANAVEKWWSKDTVAVVTGANKGIGYEIARLLASEGLTTIVTARDQARGVAAVQRILEASGSTATTDFHQLDIADKESVDRFAEWLKQKYGSIHILVNNAGIAYKGNAFGADEAQHTLATNYYGTKQICESLKLLLAKNARIVNVSSSAGRTAHIKDEALRARFMNASSAEDISRLAAEFVAAIHDGTYQQKGWPSSMYGISKLCCSMYTRVLTKELPDVMVNACCPGYCATDMSSWGGTSTAADGADTPVWLALRSPNEFVSGEFFRDRESRPW